MNTKKKKKMPTEYDAEVWDLANENLIQGFDGENALCQAIQFTNVVPAVRRLIYYKNGSTWLMWDGSRPINPPGR